MPRTSRFRSVFRLRTAWGGLLLILWMIVLPTQARAQDSVSSGSFLNFTNWRAVAFSHEIGGTLCWLTGPDGSLRLEVRRGPAGFQVADFATDGPWPAQLDPLLNWAGEGWTVVLGPDDTGTLNSWGREWQPPPVGLVQMIRLVTRSLENHPAPPVALRFASLLGHLRNRGTIPRPAWSDLGEAEGGPGKDRRYELAPLELEESTGIPEEGFRAGMAARGRGTGGVGEIVTMSWRPLSDRPGSQVKVMSSRRPGTLILESPGKRAVEPPPPELFLPLWPLAQFF